jgi:hypothetical protein
MTNGAPPIRQRIFAAWPESSERLLEHDEPHFGPRRGAALLSQPPGLRCGGGPASRTRRELGPGLGDRHPRALSPGFEGMAPGFREELSAETRGLSAGIGSCFSAPVFYTRHYPVGRRPVGTEGRPTQQLP